MSDTAYPQKYRKRPVLIEAMRVPNPFDYDATCAVLKWITDNGGVAGPVTHRTAIGYIETPEGEMLIALGDYVIRGVAGEFYPCKPDIFEQTYEGAE